MLKCEKVCLNKSSQWNSHTLLLPRSNRNHFLRPFMATTWLNFYKLCLQPIVLDNIFRVYGHIPEVVIISLCTKEIFNISPLHVSTHRSNPPDYSEIWIYIFKAYPMATHKFNLANTLQRVFMQIFPDAKTSQFIVKQKGDVADKHTLFATIKEDSTRKFSFINSDIEKEGLTTHLPYGLQLDNSYNFLKA